MEFTSLDLQDTRQACPDHLPAGCTAQGQNRRLRGQEDRSSGSAVAPFVAATESR